MSIRFTGELTTPTNPNGLVFAANAADVLQGRTWTQVLRAVSGPLHAFHEASGLLAMVGLAWRVFVDRKNRRIPQVLAVFVIDGPATSAHLAVLESMMHSSAVLWSNSHIERIPQNLVRSLIMKDGQCHQLWEMDGETPTLGTLVLGERGVSIVRVTPEDADQSALVEDLQQRIAGPPRYEDHDADLELMRLVFAQRFAQRIVEADGKVLEEEVQFLETVFPERLMRQLDVGSDASPATWFSRACEVLPDALGHHDKLAMIGLFFSACYSDGQLDAREVRVLKEAGETLGLTRHEVAHYLERFW